ncbi:uncharacterized protein LOC129751686 isoform X1 [Uranotaenia lowii]|uniref:uncharacterized protein LOC129751686 isoform X1 n=1 Tax=Uranotaenia lowii TaxID=190385 RepID=UPI0024795507|nr:uncharacterized protein LOC129751686 isoform X1 [Uranotaenia lowii]
MMHHQASNSNAARIHAASQRQQRSKAPPHQPPPPPTPAATGPGPGGGGGGKGGGGSHGIQVFRNNRSSSNSRINGLVVGPKVDTGRRVTIQQPLERPPSRATEGSSDLDYVEDDLFSKVPKMELLKVNYVNLKVDGKAGGEGEEKAKGPTPSKNSVTSAIKKQLTSNGGGTKSNNNSSSNAGNASGAISAGKETKSKYLVYKKHNGFGSNTSIAEIGAKLQYINDSDVKLKNGKKKYALFDSKKKNKLETVQYYFDSRSYERYVDNKLYGVINKDQKQIEANEVNANPEPRPPEMLDAHKRLSWDLRSSNNRPSMLRVINQVGSPVKKSPTSDQPASLQPQPSPPVKTTTFNKQPQPSHKPEGNNSRLYKLQKSHTSTNLITRHRSMNDIHRINQLFLESKVPLPADNCQAGGQAPPSLPSVLSRQHSSSVIALNRKIVPASKPTSAPPVAPASINPGVVRENVHRFEKNKSKNDEMSAKQQKYLVHKRFSARYKVEESALTIAAAAAAAAAANCSGPPTPTPPPTTPVNTMDPDDTIRKRIQRIIDGHNGHTGSSETIDSFDSVRKEHPRRDIVRARSKSLERGLNEDDNVSTISAKSNKTTTTCGYKNCKFSNCPMSSSSSSSASSTVSSSSCTSKQSAATESVKSYPFNNTKSKETKEQEIICGKRTSIVITDDGENDIVLNNALNDKLNSKNDSVRIVSSKIKEIDLESHRMIIEKCIEPMSDPTEAALARQKMWNQRNIKLNNNPQNKPYDDKVNINNKIKNEENNSIKIFISSSQERNVRTTNTEPVSLISTSTSSGENNHSSAASTVSSTDDSEKDDGYYDQSERSISPAPTLDGSKQPLSIVSTVSTGSSSSTVCSDGGGSNRSSVTCSNASVGSNSVHRYTSKTSIRLGCDGALFWNNNYFEDLDSGQSLAVTSNETSETVTSRCCNSSGSCCCCCRRRQSSNNNCNSNNNNNNSDLISSIDIGSNVNGTGCSGSTVVLRNPQQCQCGGNSNAAGGGGSTKHNGKIDSFSSRPRSIEGPPDSGISISSDTIIASSDSDLNLQSQTDSDERKLKRGHVLAELLETERIYVAEMGSILKGYRDEMLSEEMSSLVPPGLQGKADILFGNLHELYTFHNDTFLKDLENCISTTELVALCFVQRRDTFFRLYSYYCQNIPRSEQLRETLVDTHLFLQECQMKLGHKLPLAAYLLKPVQRITKYQLLLKDLLKFSDTGTCSRELQKALDCMLVVLKCVNDSMHQIAITGFPADLSQQGELLLQDSFQVWTESKKDLRLRLKTQHRHIFLYQKAMLFCKQGSKTGHNKSTYQFKHWLQMSQIGLTESVRGDPRRFEVWLQGRQEVHTIQASTVEIKNKWVAEIKRVLLNQLEELKGEKIKQYGLNHKPLRHTGSWEVPPSLHGTPNRTFSCDQQPQVVGPLSTNSLQHHVGSMAIHHQLSLDHSLSQQHHQQPQHQQIGAGDSMLSATGISSSSSEHDNQETNAWSSDYSNSEDEFTHGDGDGVLPGHKFISLADYCAMGNSEVSMKEGDIVELLKIGCAGWWFVKVVGNGLEGWAPAAYLEPMNRKSNRLRGARSQDKLNEH